MKPVYISKSWKISPIASHPWGPHSSGGRWTSLPYTRRALFRVLLEPPSPFVFVEYLPSRPSLITATFLDILPLSCLC